MLGFRPEHVEVKTQLGESDLLRDVRHVYSPKAGAHGDNDRPRFLALVYGAMVGMCSLGKCSGIRPLVIRDLQTVNYVEIQVNETSLVSVEAERPIQAEVAFRNQAYLKSIRSVSPLA
jgi:hypothetical protein